MLHQIKKLFKPAFLETELKYYTPIVKEIRSQQKTLQWKSDHAITDLSTEIIKASRNNISLDKLLVTAYALASEAIVRKLKITPYDVQLIAAIALHHGKIIEMNTGEGKTLTATLPAYLNAIMGKGVHILTFNDYLAKRDATWMQPVYEYLGLSVGTIHEGMTSDERKKAYQKNITYLTAKEGGFDYLRSSLATDSSNIILPNASFAIIDEVDSILIDEARIPMVIVGSMKEEHSVDVLQISSLVRNLVRHLDFQTDQYALNIYLTENGLKKIETQLGCNNLYDESSKNQEILSRVHQSLQAHWLLNRDVDYIVRNNTIELVDEFTGRIVENRKWPHGLQAAIEAKENIPIQPEGRILGKTTLPHFIKTYPKISGMTGTATASAEEFASVYGIPVVIIPPNKPSKRIDQPDHIFLTKRAKFNALIEEIKKVHSTGRPILVGTPTIEESEAVASRLLSENIFCETLNAKNDEEEAGIIAKAGMLGAITISTNMAGRGTDIKLGGDEGVNRDIIINLGGLYVIGTNRFESRRIDYQLRGRSGRQGDVGESRFFVSLEDDLLKKHGIDELIPKRLLKTGRTSRSGYATILREIDRAQRIVEGKNFDIRKTLNKYASIVEIQRKILHQRRQAALENNSESLLAEHNADHHYHLTQQFGKTLIEKVEAQVTIAIIDKHWADYLEEVERIRQGIYLVTLGGMDPFYEFQKQTAELFKELLSGIDNAIIFKMTTLQITADGIDLEKEDLTTPTSTWTYLVNDNPFGDKLENILRGTANMGLAAGAAILWPLLTLYFFTLNVFQKHHRRR
jgi:preprotein translocase subunit SecA